MPTDGKLWKVYSEYIRIRDADSNGICTCFTCGDRKHWKNMDCGHGIPRQHKATKYDERNNQSQCRKCNWLEGGRREVYKEEVNKKYGPQTWEKLELMSRTVCKRGKFEYDIMIDHYKKEVSRLKLEKGL